MTAESEQNARISPFASPPQIAARRMVVWTYFKVILLQVLLTLCFVTPLLFLGGKLAALSASIGGGIAIVGSLVYARIALVVTDSAGAILLAHFGAEIAKVLATVAMFAVVLLLMKWVIVGWLLTAFAVALAGYWLALLLIK
jgi:ATP synthase protein I